MPFDSHVSSDTSSGTASGVEVEAEPTSASEEEAVTVAPIWLQRVSLFVLVLFCVYLGAFIEARPALAAVLHMGAVRGLISGLGLLDIWIGVSEAIHYRDHRA
jgi:hypothetical protein